MSSIEDKILENLPYGNSFLFIKKIVSVDRSSIITEVNYPSTAFFYSSHYVNNPVVPGVIITESIGQSALMSHLYFLMGVESFVCKSLKCFLTDIHVEFLDSPKFDTIYMVKSEKKFFRNNLFRATAILVDNNNNIYAQFNGSLKVI